MLKLVRFSCGCIGTPPDDEHMSVLIQTCDGDSDLCFFIRDMGAKEYDGLSPEATRIAIRSIGQLMSDGHSLHTLRDILEKPRE